MFYSSPNVLYLAQMPTTLLYLESCTWEFDFVTKDILSNIEFNTEMIHPRAFQELLKRTDIINTNILVVNEVVPLDNILEVVKHLKPLAILYMSDECGNQSRILQLDQYTPLFFRQYNHSHYSYSENNRQLVLGYSRYFTGSNTSLTISRKKIAERTINASFIGQIKSDRFKMLTTFDSAMTNTQFIPVHNTWNLNALPCPPAECFNIYNNSIFVLCGRGNKSLDCFRIYEAIVAGALPVIVGTPEEIATTFHYGNNRPPAIYAESWENAAIQCNELLTNRELLQEMQDRLLRWWNAQILQTNALICNELAVRTTS